MFYEIVYHKRDGKPRPARRVDLLQRILRHTVVRPVFSTHAFARSGHTSHHFHKTKGCVCMSIGMVLLTVVAVLVFFGVAQRVLDKLYLSDRAALILIALMFFGTLIPNVTIGNVSISIGGAVIPFGVCVYLLARAGTAKERVRAILGSLITAGIIYALSHFLPDEPERMLIDPMYLYGLAGGVVAYVLGRSRRGAFFCGVVGVMLADIAVAVVNWSQGVDQPLVLGGAGVFDAMIISGILGVLLSELVGEVLERMARGTQRPRESAIENPVRQKEK